MRYSEQNHFSFSLSKIDKKNRARVGKIHTARGDIDTPVFMPVGSAASVKSLTPDDLTEAGTQIILANTYHLYLRPGDLLIKKLGGLHSFMGWKKPILTDSGGYQVSSLGYFIEEMEEGHKRQFRSEIDDDGVYFRSHIDGTRHRITPEKAIEIQENLGSDIIMAFDEATPDRGKLYAREAMKRTHNWLLRCIKHWKLLEHRKKGMRDQQMLFGIIQGGNYRDLRRQSSEFVVGQNLPGIAIGGGSIGQNVEETRRNLDWIVDILPKDKPLYLMGVGVTPEDVIGAIEAGADMFDCVAPTRLARMGNLYHGKLLKDKLVYKFSSEFNKGRLNIDNSRFKNDAGPVLDGCDCYTCRQGFSRAYLHHLFRCKELLYYRLASIHNIRFMIRLTENLRELIGETSK